MNLDQLWHTVCGLGVMPGAIQEILTQQARSPLGVPPLSYLCDARRDWACVRGEAVAWFAANGRVGDAFVVWKELCRANRVDGALAVFDAVAVDGRVGAANAWAWAAALATGAEAGAFFREKHHAAALAAELAGRVSVEAMNALIAEAVQKITAVTAGILVQQAFLAPPAQAPAPESPGVVVAAADHSPTPPPPLARGADSPCARAPSESSVAWHFSGRLPPLPPLSQWPAGSPPAEASY